ncbi:hypothetical protein [Streptomyces mirabilis]|uniref:hypothetical protein n=1 Tax=Streptomyces mirabilis TaxID=68239 RepID=UPI00371595E4
MSPRHRRPFPLDHYERMAEAIRRDITHPRNLNPERRQRSYPRLVKRARHNSYRVKRPGDTGTRHPTPLTIRLANLPEAA